MPGDGVKMIQNPPGFFVDGNALKPEEGILSTVSRLVQLRFASLVVKPYFFLFQHRLRPVFDFNYSSGNLDLIALTLPVKISRLIQTSTSVKVLTPFWRLLRIWAISRNRMAVIIQLATAFLNHSTLAWIMLYNI
jgi:hypothetical protein